MKNIFISLLVLSAILFQPVYSQEINIHKLDSLFNILSDNNRIMGSLVISKNRKCIYSKSIGFSQVSEKKKIPATIDTRYRIGSITKMFTAAIIFQLAEENKIDLSNKLSSYFPQLPNSKSITISSLLYHRSGFPDFMKDHELIKSITSHPNTKEEMLAYFSKMKTDFEPEKKAEYSNTNYVLLGYIIENICGKPFGDVLNERITSKIGLDNTYSGNKINVDKNECYSFLYSDKWEQRPDIDISNAHAAGAIVSTPTDLIKFIEALFSYKLTSKRSINQMITIKDDFGMGVDSLKIEALNKVGYGHSGRLGEYRSLLFYFPDDSLAIAFCTNGTAIDHGDIYTSILKICYNMESNRPTFPLSSDLNKYCGFYTSKQLALRFFIYIEGSDLIIEPVNKPAARLKYLGGNNFECTALRAELAFNNERDEVIITKNGKELVFVSSKIVNEYFSDLKSDLTKALTLIKEQKDEQAKEIVRLNLGKGIKNKFLDEDIINLIGYKQIEKNYILAVEIFKSNTVAFPNSANAFDSLGEAYMKAENKELAILNYEKSLQLNPKNENAAKMIKILREK